MTRHGHLLGPLLDVLDCPACDGTGTNGLGGMCWPCADTGSFDPEATPEQMAEARLDYERVAREPA